MKHFDLQKCLCNKQSAELGRQGRGEYRGFRCEDLVFMVGESQPFYGVAFKGNALESIYTELLNIN